MEKRWVIKNRADSKIIEHLSEILSISDTLSNLLIQRGITDYDTAKKFFRPQLSDLYNPFLMKDMDKAVQRITNAINKKEKILVYGDYDVDGTTSVAMMYSFLIKYNENVEFYIPDRNSEGYGISFKGIDFASDNQYSLVIALDCGIKAVDKIEYANKKNIDFIICDHHTPDEKLPEAFAILDPKRIDCNYPFKELSGCGVGFKLIQAYCLQNKINEQSIYPLLDFVVVSIASDIVPMIDENRILAYFGLKQLNENPSTGLKSIIQTSGLKDKKIDISDIVFKIGPKLNAAGRIEKGVKSVELLISSDNNNLISLTEQINDDNDTRKNLDRSITAEAINSINENDEYKNRKSIVVYNPEWHKGVVGIVASRLIENFYKPSIVLTKSNNMVTGSARSVQGFDLYAAINKCSYLLESFGGHKYAAGVTLKEENVNAFRECFEQSVSEQLLPEQLIPQIKVADIISLNKIDTKFYNILKQFEPFGPENMKPVFMSEKNYDSGYGRLVGNDKKHIKLAVYDNSIHYKIPAIGFNLSSRFNIIHDHKPFDICYTIEENTFNGKTNLQLSIKDIKEYSGNSN